MPIQHYHIIPWIQNFCELVHFFKVIWCFTVINYIQAIPWTTAKEYYMQYTTIDHIFNKWYLILDIWIFTSPLRMREDLGERAKFSIVQLWSCVKVEVGSSWAPVRNKPTVYVDVKQHSTNQLSTLVAAQWRGDTALTFSLWFWRRSTASLVFRAGAPPTTTRHTTTHAQTHTHTHTAHNVTQLSLDQSVILRPTILLN